MTRLNAAPQRMDHLTFRGNLRRSRFGWLRLTPAYSVHLVEQLLDRAPRGNVHVLDPFCGTGTTALMCALRGIDCDSTDINPFLLWLAAAKCARYDRADLSAFDSAAARIRRAIVEGSNGERRWAPPIHDISKWWDPPAIDGLSRAMHVIRSLDDDVTAPAARLLRIAFCRTLIAHANVSFGHQSMSFKRTESGDLFASTRIEELAATWAGAVEELRASAAVDVAATPRLIDCDARRLTDRLESDRYSLVITSPPYPNRMSYIRELRPYMYWLGLLEDGRAAGELDWKAIGGTWGCATSNLKNWKPSEGVDVPESVVQLAEEIGKRSSLLGTYVLKYFHDMVLHIRELKRVMRRGSSAKYVVGNSKFYDVVVPVEQLFAQMFEDAGLTHVGIETIRKRTSKKELFEFVVSARRG